MNSALATVVLSPAVDALLRRLSIVVVIGVFALKNSPCDCSPWYCRSWYGSQNPFHDAEF
jgi:hypothetical protein